MQCVRRIVLVGIFALIFIMLAGCLPGGDDEEETFDPAPNPDAEQISAYDDERMAEQAEMDDELSAEYEDGSYSFEDPFIKLNPYGVTPLAALVKFETEEPVEIEVAVGNGDGQVPIQKKWDGYSTSHEIPVLGLYPDTENTVVLKAEDEEGDTQTTEFSITTEPLPEDLPETDLEKANPRQMEDGLTFVIPSKNYLYAVDHNADVRWYADMPFRHIFNRLENGNVVFNTKESGQEKYNQLLEMDMLGNVANAYEITIDGYEKDFLLHHDVIELPNGNLLATTHEPDSKYVEDYMHTIDRETGETIQEIDLKELFPKAAYEDYDGEYAEDNDWFHLNAVWFDENDQSILISGRHQDAVMKLSYPEAEIEWILASPEGWPDKYDNYLLEAESDDVKFPAAQHAMKTLPDMDGNDDTLDVLLFDNNKVITRGDRDESGQYSRAVQYRIDESDGSVDEVWSYGEERGKAFYSTIVGNTQYLPQTGNRLITSGYIAPDEDEPPRISKIVETNDQAEADVLFEITVAGFEEYSGRQAYRAIRMPLYPE
ncbi:arylsulfate sulfotransferase [Lentibacillus persicus]|uniref:Arylsulfate sulfotransferase n=1 Tax=Lentibacillus persicus TaxID=640948 RepID=A0A1I1VXC9_9BACI|nr:aryl-sulfate sulfotransferase [Lentibacillus persicus]SFD86728.1 arylsulfate sulfotransferase [Lentibacillus persicus]